ncbi:hypothetical protein MUY35_11715 [Aliiroseovarius sp. S1339]|uniref:hypothetical protein n=1 Tax=Aliiroseovarius sp. S1339 TaxID=2936990 RepID=UPI0020BE82C5|nr:hypothetical protein [Aliiroseovarius sp. S1339]MCK8464519.1 hypothetical protein [Aliiroseovarius sp. S1339]
MSASALIAATIGSGTALFIAFVAYPIQKRRDRRLLVETERRHAYRRFVTEAVGYSRIRTDSGSELEETIRGLASAAHELALYAPPEVMRLAKNYIYSETVLQAKKSALPKEEWKNLGHNPHEVQMFTAMRKDLFGDKDLSNDEIQAFLRLEILEEDKT